MIDLRCRGERLESIVLLSKLKSTRLKHINSAYIHKTDVEKTKEILLESVSQIIERINSITALDFDENNFMS